MDATSISAIVIHIYKLILFSLLIFSFFFSLVLSFLFLLPVPSRPFFSFFLSFPVLSCTVLSCPVLSCPILSYPFLSYPVLSCPVLFCSVSNILVPSKQGPESAQAEIVCQSNRGSSITSGGGFSRIYKQPTWQENAIAG